MVQGFGVVDQVDQQLFVLVHQEGFIRSFAFEYRNDHFRFGRQVSSRHDVFFSVPVGDKAEVFDLVRGQFAFAEDGIDSGNVEFFPFNQPFGNGHRVVSRTDGFFETSESFSTKLIRVSKLPVKRW